MNSNGRSLVHCALLACVAVGASQAAAQVPLSSRAAGMAGAYVGLARGQEAVFLNPANLGLADNPRWSVAIPQAFLGLTLAGPEASDLSDYLDYDDLTDQERQDLLDRIPSTGSDFDVDLRLPLVAISAGRFGLGLAYGVIGGHSVSKDVVDLFLNGYDPARTDYQIDETGGKTSVGTQGRSARYWDAAAAYGMRLGPLSVGATGHLYFGGSVARARGFNPSYTGPFVPPFDARNITVEYTGVTATGGQGFGLDVGAALQPMPGLTLSGAVSNIASSFSYDENLVGRRLVLDRGDFEADFADVRQEFDNSDTDLGDTPTGTYALVAAGLTEDAVPASTLRLGAGLVLPSRTRVSAAYHKNLKEGRLSGRWEQLMGVGIEQRLPIITVRGGLSSDGEDASMASVGLSLGPIDLSATKLVNGKVFDSDREGWLVSFGLRAQPRR